MIPIVTIEGPTASGKSALALELAHKLNTEIISADSRQVYQYLNIGTAKPREDELKDIKHHLIDIIKPNESYNAGLFRKDATRIIKELSKQGKIPVICGGTGLYIRSLIEGLFETVVEDKTIKDDLITECKIVGVESLYQQLMHCDKEAAEKINNNDKQRIIRALEVYKATGVPLSEHWKTQKLENEFTAFRICLVEERIVLYQRIDARVLLMIELGLVDEIKAVLNFGYTWEDPGFNSVGYKEFKPHINNEISLEDCVSLAQQHTRNYAKRQVTWYRKCNFNLSDAYKSIIISNVERQIKAFFNR